MEMIEISIHKILHVTVDLVKELSISTRWTAQNSGPRLCCITHTSPPFIFLIPS